ncbi:hypothetical protein LRP50_11885 [Enterovibrio sp. ZSDZ42]|uniref:Lipoprotein n=1 Tax=Enterovibrio gelatinilyticus TaxID=2899819 RepID=A0ABT5R0P0_9GAMM|nr:hypothetical protein [Enterovibrio sp. ZSDZ42]MDD1793833.1 hypothetical protein [Enterovibrio sp. ZSDZ42]
MKSMILLLTLLLSACSADIGRGIAESDCSKIRNNADREQCYKDVERTFEHYP